MFVTGLVHDCHHIVSMCLSLKDMFVTGLVHDSHHIVSMCLSLKYMFVTGLVYVCWWLSFV